MRKSLVFMFVIIVGVAYGQSEVFTKSGEAIQGYDPVAYFTESKPVLGKEQFNFKWKDATWRFASAENLAAFKLNPEKYAPQFGGYCAYGIADGHKAPTSADAWTIVDDKLYLNYNTSVKTMWDKDRAGYINKANSNWTTVKQQKE